MEILPTSDFFQRFASRNLALNVLPRYTARISVLKLLAMELVTS